MTISSFASETNQKSDTTIYSISDTLVIGPVFTYKNKQAGKESIHEFYRDSLKYPLTQDCMGKVLVKFVVEKDGSLTNICIIRALPGCNEYNEEAIRLIRLMNGLWKPASKAKENVRYVMYILVAFDLEKN